MTNVFLGEAHWEVLLRARAIECQCYVIAAAQAGRHNDKRESYGHSLVIDPWGRSVHSEQLHWEVLQNIIGGIGGVCPILKHVSVLTLIRLQNNSKFGRPPFNWHRDC